MSLLNIPSKVLERCIFMDLYSFLRPSLHNGQHGFRSNRSCITQLLIYLDKLYVAMDNGANIDVVYTDFEKALDKVDHGVLLKKLWDIGVRGNLWRLIRSYLVDRMQMVRVGDCLSAAAPVTNGVPLGSLLGPLFFLILINDLPLACLSEILLCADDAKLISRDPSHLQCDLNSLHNWCSNNNMHVNAQKCCLISFGRSRISHHREPYIDSMTLPYSPSQVDLGLLVSSSLKWDNHVLDKLSKANRSFYAVRRNSYGLSPKAKINIYKTIILPVITYASTCWYANISSLKKIESYQKKVLRWTVGGMSYSDGLVEANILPLSLYLQLIDLLFLSNVLDGRYDIDTSQLIRFEDSQRQTRQADYPRFRLCRPRTKLCEQNFWFRAPGLANRLPRRVEYFKPVGLKARLLKHFWDYFQTAFQWTDSATWRL